MTDFENSVGNVDVAAHFIEAPGIAVVDDDDKEVEAAILGTGNIKSAKDELLAKEKEKAWSMMKTASAVFKDQDPYPSPYLNISDYQLPKTMVEIFKWCRYFFKFDSLIGAAVNTMSRFPVTDVIFEEASNLDNGPYGQDDSPVLGFYKDQFDYLDINEFLVKIGIDYWLYGNCFVFGETEDYSEAKDGSDIRWSKIYRLDPSKMVIELNPLTQECIYKWLIPEKIVALCKAKRPAKDYNAVPMIIRKAAETGKPVILNQENIYHFSREGESGDGSVWGTPLILNVMKQLAYRNLLRQAQEAIAREHIVPMRVYYLTPTQTANPDSNWGKVARDLADQLEKAAKDPNYKVVSPVPVNKIDIGGNGRALMLTAEIEQLQAEILAGMGVPREFIFGGVSYSAASISLRTLENQFINYRLLLVDFMNNFLIKKLAMKRGEYRTTEDKGNLITVKLADLKMQDDIQQKQMVINMNATGKVSDDYMYNMLGMDPQKMKVQIEVETFERMDRERRMQLYNLETQYMMQQNQTAYQANLMAQQQQLGITPSPEEQAQQMVQQQKEQEDKELVTAQADAIKKEKKKEAVDKVTKKPEKKASAADDDADLVKYAAKEMIVTKIASEMAKLSPEKVAELMTGFPESIREQAMERLAALNPQALGASASRNIKLSKMTELEKLQEGQKMVQKSVMDTYSANIENAMMPHSQILPERRMTAV